MKRYVYAFDSIGASHEAMAALRSARVDEARMSLIARTDLQLRHVPPRLLDAGTDFPRAVARGAAIGSAAGLAIGIALMLVPAFSIPAGVWTVLAFLAGGAIVGAWTLAIVGSGLPDPVREAFADEIDAGRVLLVVDSDAASEAGIRRTLAERRDPHLLWQSAVRMPKF